MGEIIGVISSLISFALAFALSAMAGYYITTYLIPEKSRSKFFNIIPLYPKREYAIILYSIAIILSFSFLFLFDGGFMFQMYVCMVSMIIGSQSIKVIARVRKESVKNFKLRGK
jgi:hypothetical protein